MTWLETTTVTAAGAVIALVLLLVVASRWKLPLRESMLGSAGAVVVIALIVGLVAGDVGTSGHALILLLVQVTASMLLAFGLAMICFWRDPERTPPEKDKAILAAADGEVLYVHTIGQKGVPLVSKNGRDFHLAELTGIQDVSQEQGAEPGAWEGAHVLGIEMNLLNVHVNRCPIAGEITLLHHVPGRFISLRREEAPFVNERFTTVIQGEYLSVAVVQVASRLVRRIESYLDEGQQVSQSQRLGRIRFGSLVAVIIPARADVRIIVEPGSKVKAGESILARYADDGLTEESSFDASVPDSSSSAERNRVRGA